MPEKTRKVERIAPLTIAKKLAFASIFANTPLSGWLSGPRMRLIYNLLFTILFVLSSPYYFLKMWRRGNWRLGFGQRFGLFSADLQARLNGRPVLWLHAVSVGEAGICAQLIQLLAPRLPDCQLLVSTTTTTGMGELQKKLPDNVIKIYYPADFWWGVRRALAVIKPRAIILVEAEFWPNLLWQALDRKIPLFLVNARVSDRSFKGYKRAGFLFRSIFARFRAAGCQDADDAARLEQLGFQKRAIHLVGNLKFDLCVPPDRIGVAAMLNQLGVHKDARVLVCGSTHDGEEAILGAMFLRLRQTYPDLFLIMVPRHFERAKEVSDDLERCKLQFARRTEITPETRFAPGQVNCLLVDSTGELVFFYRHATVVFVGKSLTAKGGQNPIEAAALGKAVVFGPNMQNFRTVARALVRANGAVQVANSEDLEKTISSLLENAARRSELGANAMRFVQQSSGATARTIDFLVAEGV